MNRMHKPFTEYKDSKDPIERLVYFINNLSPHNYHRGYDAIKEFCEQIREEQKKKDMDAFAHIVEAICKEERVRQIYKEKLEDIYKNL